MTGGPITCVVADDHPAMLAALAEILERNGIGVLGRAPDGEEALAQIEALQAAVALVDIRMPRLSGIEVAEPRACGVARAPRSSSTPRSATGRCCRRRSTPARAGSCSRRRRSPTSCARSSGSPAGETYVDPVLAGILVSAQMAAKLPTLTQREREVLRLLADGLANEEIGKRLFISPETVRTHVRKAMTKLEADTRTQAVATALRQSLIS